MILRGKHTGRTPGNRRGAVVVLAAFFMVVVFLMLAFAVDVGYIVLARTQLQTSADSAAMAAASVMALTREEMEAEAKQYAAANTCSGNRVVQLQSSDIEYGMWDTASRTFTPTATVGNAVRVTARADEQRGGNIPLFFGRMFGVANFAQQASAVAMCNPRDIVFVVDCSGSMNDDSDPANTDSLNSMYAPLGYPNVGTELMQKVYDDFGFGTWPGTSEWIGKPLGVSQSNAYTNLTKNGGPLTSSSIPSKYRILSSDSSSVRKQKAYSWIMDVQIPALMPAAKPVPNSSTNYNYWAKYIDGNQSALGYRSYTQFMMYYGRDGKPDGVNYTPLSLQSPHCPMHAESTPAGVFNFPPREQPTHACRRGVIAAINIVKQRNQGINDPTQRDWVSIVTFDKTSPGPVVRQPLTGDYDAAMQVATTFQAVASGSSSTATENGLIVGAGHIKRQSLGGQGRETANKVVVLLTDGMPNLYQSSNTTINNYVSANPSPDFYPSGTKYASQAALMQTMMMQLQRWQVFPVGIGLETDYDFMDRMARMGNTAKDGQSPRGSGNPAEYEQRLIDIFEEIILSPRVRLVQ